MVVHRSKGQEINSHWRQRFGLHFHKDRWLIKTIALGNKEKTNKWDCIKLKSFCMAKETIIKMKRELTVWENIFASDTLDKGLISKIHKGHI